MKRIIKPNAESQTPIFSMRLPRDELEALQSAALEASTSVSGVVRQALAEKFAKELAKQR